MSDARLPINHWDTGLTSRNKINDSFNDLVTTVQWYRPHIESWYWWIWEINTWVKAIWDSVSLKVEDWYIWYKSESVNNWTQIIAIEDLKWDKWDQWDPFTYDDFTEEQLEALTWPQWPKGDKWDKGDQWIQGIQGEQWDKWDKGDTGASIVSAAFNWNDIQFNKDDSTYVTLLDAKTELRWPQWEQGIQWVKWDTGEKWDKWDKGDKGDKWDTWASIISASFVDTDLVFSKDDSTDVVLEWAKTTLTWPQWPKWDTGNTWPKGDTGASIVQAWFSGDDMVFTKDDSTSVTIENAKPALKWDTGATGAKGDTWNWISSVTATKSWKTTTVTMNYTSWNPTVFQVQDWADGEWSWDMSMSTYDPTSKMADAFDYDNMYNTPTIPTKVSDLQNDSEFITKAVNDLTNYYTKTQTYTKSEVDTLISNFGWFEVVSVLPTQNIKTNVIYMLWPIGTWPDKYEEWIYSNNAWVKIWETTVDLTNYFNKTTDDTDDITEWTTNKFVTAAEKTTWNNKQDAISDLSTIRTNATAWAWAATTISWYWNIVTHNTSEFATSSQWWKADTAVQPWDLATIATSGNLSDANGDSDDITQWSTNLFLTSAERTKLSNTSWTNTGDETASTIKTKLWITTLSWSNTWDETQTSIKTKLWAATSSADWYLTKEDFATFNWKQDALVSGTNIKTINSTSVLWTWDIAVQPVISDLATIRSGASAWATAVQPWDNISDLENDSWFITGSSIDDTAFWVSWDWDTTHAPSKNAIYDVLWDVETLLAAL